MKSHKFPLRINGQPISFGARIQDYRLLVVLKKDCLEETGWEQAVFVATLKCGVWQDQGDGQTLYALVSDREVMQESLLDESAHLVGGDEKALSVLRLYLQAEGCGRKDDQMRCARIQHQSQGLF